MPPSGQSRVIFQVIADMFVLFICFVFGIKTDEFCEGYPHNFTPTPGYWIECSRQSGRGSRRSHGIQEEGSQEDSSPSGDDDDDDDDEDSRAGQDEEENDVGIQTEKDGQRHANGSTSVFTSTDSAGPSDRAGRKVQLVHQHIQVPVDESPLEKKNIATCLPSHNSPSKPLLPFCSFAMEFFFLFFFHLYKSCSHFPHQVSSTSLPEIHELQARRKTAIEEQFDRAGTFELTSVEQETYERYFYGTEHWNYFSNDEDLGPVVLSLKQEIINGRDQFRSVFVVWFCFFGESEGY